ncbi:MAG TPA: polysaccharide deacetylase family protein [Solirubrobacteraceae bacterium]|nr:polysaccharide deacetylase family protein [Solirubrobacteraceae bacterium]
MALRAMSRLTRSARRGGTWPGPVVLGGALALVVWLQPLASAGSSPTSHAGRPIKRSHLISYRSEIPPIFDRWVEGPHAALLGPAHVRVRRLAHAPTAENPPTPPAQPPPTPPAPPTRYRPIGCVRRGPAVAYGHGPRRKEVALTFDDGPFPLTPSFVRMLEANHAVATFFTIGEQLSSRYRATLHEELRDGDVLGDHTYTHPDLVRSGGVRSQLQRTLWAIRGLSGYTPCVFRPPYGDYDGSVVRTAASLGMATILWEVDPSDYTLPGAGAIRQRVLAQVRPGSIVLSHDGGGPRGQTLAAYPGIIRALRARGYRFVTVPQLLGFHAVYRRCVRNCEGAAIVGRPPPGSIVEPG